MSRTVPAAILTALSQPEVQPFYAVEMLFDTSPLRIWTGVGERVIGGDTYTGAGQLLTVDGLEEAGDLTALSAVLTLSGVPSSIVALALDEPYQRRRCRVLFGVRDVADAVEVFSGLMNTMAIEDSGETSKISLMVDSKLVELERAKIRRYTHESQQSRHSGDTFFSFVADLQDRDVAWGRKA